MTVITIMLTKILFVLKFIYMLLLSEHEALVAMD